MSGAVEPRLARRITGIDTWPRDCARRILRGVTDADDVELVRRALGRDRGSQRQLAARLLDAIHREVGIVTSRHAAARGRDRQQDVIDLVQEVLISLFEKDGQELRRWDPARGRSLESFARLVARRRVARMLTQFRGNPWSLVPVDVVGDAIDEPEARLEDRADLEVVLDGLYAGMDTRDAELFELVFVDELESDEIAKRMGMTSGAVNAWRYRVRKVARRLATDLRANKGTSSAAGGATRGQVADG